MQREDFVKQLREYIAIHILDGKDIGLDEETPLLEWGILNSLEIVQLLSFIQQTFEVEIPHDQIIAENFINLNAVTDMILECLSSSEVY